MASEPWNRAIFVVGAGAVGVGLAQALAARGLGLAGVWNRSQAGRGRAAAILGRPVAGGPLPAELGEADLVLVAVADTALEEVAADIGESGRLRRGAVVAHTSGVLPAAALAASGGAHLGSLHPLRPIPSPEQAAELLAGAPFAIEGEARAVALLSEIARLLGGTCFPLSAAAKPRYHAAAVLASNLVLALVDLAAREAAGAGVPQPEALLAALAADALDQVTRRGLQAALTGPVARGDAATLARHLAVLSPATRQVYRELSRQALAIAQARGLADAAADRIRALLDEPSP